MDGTEKEAQRVSVGDTALCIGGIKFDIAELAAWKHWSLVEAACLRLDPRITVTELATVEEVANKSGSGALAGFAELKSALSRLFKVPSSGACNGKEGSCAGSNDAPTGDLQTSG